VIWGHKWDPLLKGDHDGLLKRRMDECVDGEYQTFKSRDGKYVRENFFGAYPELAKRVEDWSDDEIWSLNRGGHDPTKVYAAYAEAMRSEGRPTVILAKTVKGYGMGEAGEGQNITHQQKKVGDAALRQFRDRFAIPISDEDLDELPFYKPAEDSPEMKYLHERRKRLGGYLPARRLDAPLLRTPELEAFKALLESSGERELSTTMAFVRLLQALPRDKQIADRLVPIVADEARTFGMEGMFRQLGIYSPWGQLYRPEDADQLAYYREAKNGQILQEGITEAGAMSSWMAAGTAYANHGLYMIPFFIFYSMFGFQRIGDLIWAAGDMQANGFLLGATSGRTTLNGEGLQHQDGSSQLAAANVPNCVAYDPTYAYELAVIMQDGLRRMYHQGERVFYYITVLNENYPQPEMPAGVEEGIRKGLYKLRAAAETAKAGAPRVQLLGSGAILREVVAAADLLRDDFGVEASVWSAPSFTELRRDGAATERWNRLHPTETARVSYVESCLGLDAGVVVASTDYVRAYADLIRPWVRGRYITLGTDGYGRSDSRAALRRFFEVDRQHVAVAALDGLARQGTIEPKMVASAIAKYGLAPDAPAPWTV
jgi:pyruvate dehydrogenase E1 component